MQNPPLAHCAQAFEALTGAPKRFPRNKAFRNILDNIRWAFNPTHFLLKIRTTSTSDYFFSYAEEYLKALLSTCRFVHSILVRKFGDIVFIKRDWNMIYFLASTSYF